MFRGLQEHGAGYECSGYMRVVNDDTYYCHRVCGESCWFSDHTAAAGASTVAKHDIAHRKRRLKYVGIQADTCSPGC